MNTLIYQQQHAPFLQEDSPNTTQLGSGKIESHTQACLITKFCLLRTKKAEASESGEPKLLESLWESISYWVQGLGKMLIKSAPSGMIS